VTAPRRKPSSPPLVASVTRAIAEIAKREPALKKSWQAELALTLAREIVANRDDDSLSARVSASKELREVMASLRAAAPAAKQPDRLDELTAAREKRKASA